MKPDDNNQFLSSLGINHLDDDKKDDAQDTMLQVLNARVGNRVVSSLDENQLKEFDELTSEYELNDGKLSAWFEKNVPEYKQILAEEALALKEENQAILGDSDEGANND